MRFSVYVCLSILYAPYNETVSVNKLYTLVCVSCFQRNSEKIEVLTATCTVVKHLVDASIPGLC